MLSANSRNGFAKETSIKKQYFFYNSRDFFVFSCGLDGARCKETFLVRPQIKCETSTSSRVVHAIAMVHSSNHVVEGALEKLVC